VLILDARPLRLRITIVLPIEFNLLIGGTEAVDARVLVVSDRDEPREAVSDCLAETGLRVCEVRNGVEAWQDFDPRHTDLVVCALASPGLGCVDLMRRIRSVSTVPVIAIGAADDVRAAVAAIRSGAQEYLRWPEDRDRLERRALELAREPGDSTRLASRIVGCSDSMRSVRDRVSALASLIVPVLVSGESGTGRDHIVRSIAELGAGGPVRISRITRDAPEATRRVDASGAVYLDGIDTFAPVDQARWSAWFRELETLDERRHPRIFASTTTGLARLALGESIDPTLAERLLRFEIRLPPLRERKEDVPDLALHLAHRIATEMGRSQIRIEPEASELLAAQNWSGNVRELASVVEKLVAFSPRGFVAASMVREILDEARDGVSTLRERREDQQREELVGLLELCGGNIAEVARRLDLSRGAVTYRAQKYGLLPQRRGSKNGSK